MAYIQSRTNIFRNENKPSEKHPDWSGSFEIDGNLLQGLIDNYKNNNGKAKVSIAFWDAQQSKTGSSYFSATLSTKGSDDGGKGYKKPEPKPQPEPIELDDEILF